MTLNWFYKILIPFFCITFTIKPSSTMIGQTINNYLLEHKLGEGGMGEVFFARHNRIERVVAIKILHKNLFTNEIIRSRFKNEANALIKLNHPNIVKIYDYVEQEGFACLIMEYIDGITLDDYISKISGPLPTSKAIHIISNVLEAVQYAHENHVFHRDIKPGNIMVSRDGGMVRIMDFGIAKFADASNLKITHANAQLGTPFYMSPEQVKGLPYSTSSDIYSLGVTFFEMVTGKCPYLEITNLFDLQSKIVNEPLPPTDKYYPNVLPKFQEAIRIATSKTPEQRFKSCYEFKIFLQEGEKIRTEPGFKQTQIQTSVQTFTPYPINIEISRQQLAKSQHQVIETKKKYKWLYPLFFTAILGIGILVYSFLNKTKGSEPQVASDKDTTSPEIIIPFDTATYVNSIEDLRIKESLKADSIISEREMRSGQISDSVVRNQLKEILIHDFSNSTLHTQVILDSAFGIIFKIIPQFPAQWNVKNDLAGKSICGVVFSQKILFHKFYTRPLNNGQKLQITGIFKSSKKDEIISVTVFYSLEKEKYVYDRFICRSDTISIILPADPGKKLNTCEGAPPLPTISQVKASFRVHLQSGNYKSLGIEYLEIDQVSESVRLISTEPNDNCINVDCGFEYLNKNIKRNFKITFTNKNGIYTPIKYKSI